MAAPAASSDIKRYVKETRDAHKTHKYHNDGLIVRRGASVKLWASAENAQSKSIAVTPVNSTKLSKQPAGPAFQVVAGSPVNGWSVEVVEGVHGGSDFTLTIPANASVGTYELAIGSDKAVCIVLFNPWSKDDTVYLADEAQLNEYILKDTGMIWVGSPKSNSGRPWNFAQFNTKSLLVSIELLEQLPYEDRDDPVKVSRFLSAIVNSSDDGGVLTGNWSGNYEGGESPTAWTGSAEILAKFFETKRPVKFGQCWVFSGVMTSVFRSLGIPARSVTNFSSAHDSTKPYNRAVDKYFDANGNLNNEKTEDSIWNFHVWNEVWMTRPDLAAESEKYKLDFGGWQAVDATPQEESHGIYQMGPASLTAVKNGIDLPYDTDFVIGEVNADVCHYWDGPDGQPVLRHRDSYTVGVNISTKKAGSDEREDVTHLYKFPEGSKEERDALLRRNKAEVPVVDDAPQDIELSIKAPAAVGAGKPVNIKLIAKNTATEPRTALLRILARAVDYTGTAKAILDNKSEEKTIAAGEVTEITISVTPEEYKTAMEQGMQAVHFLSSAKVKETDQAWASESLVRIQAATVLAISHPREVKLGSKSSAVAIITNPFSFPLAANSVLRVEGQGLTKLQTIQVGEVKPGETKKVPVSIHAVRAGTKTLVFTLDTNMPDVVLSAKINVLKGNNGASYVDLPETVGYLERLLGSLGGLAGREE
ncbi:hypothetical protein HK102_000906 [Quaeritorhiza haematococci]|nr:hypothetical protein HK102_000906 [Quaeritorhiza haematococci]